MASVTQRIKQIKQPYGGYVPVKSFDKAELNDGKQLLEENLHKYFISVQELYDWLDEQAKKEKRQRTIVLIYGLFVIGIIVFALFKILK